MVKLLMLKELHSVFLIFAESFDVCIVHDARQGRLLCMVLNEVYFIDKIIQVGNVMIAYASTKL